MYLARQKHGYSAFIEETGNFGFDFDANGTSSHFMVTAIIIKNEDIDNIRSDINLVFSKFFGNDEINSSSVLKDHSQRFKVLKELINYDFKVFCLIVDKRKMYDGSPVSTYKKTFLKYLNNILYRELKLLYPILEINADENGSEEFMDEFSDYVYNTAAFGFFDEYHFEFTDSRVEPLIQLADFISKTISFGFEKLIKCEEYKGYYNLLKDKIIALKLWPLTYENYLINIDLIGKSEYDEKIATYCLRLSTNYIKEHSNYETDRDRILVLEYLLNQLYTSNPNRYIHSKELIRYINNVSKIRYTDQTFKTNIIACLRDSGVIISSSANGYKIPVSKVELYSYTNITLGMVMPMLERLSKCRDKILSVTNNELDILDVDEYKKIKRYFDEANKNL